MVSVQSSGWQHNALLHFSALPGCMQGSGKAAVQPTAASSLPAIMRRMQAQGVSGSITSQQVDAQMHAAFAERTELSVTLCSDDYIAELNAEWRRVAGPTDVLSFPMGPAIPGCPVRMLGDLIISIPTAQRQADERG